MRISESEQSSGEMVAEFLALGNEFGSWEASAFHNSYLFEFEKLYSETERKIVLRTGFSDARANEGTMYLHRSASYLDFRENVDRAVLREALISTSDSFRTLLFAGRSEKELTAIDANRAVAEYREFLARREAVARLLQMRKNNVEGSLTANFRIPYVVFAEITVGSNGKIKVNNFDDEVLLALDIDKIWECESCGKVFLSIRSTKRYCSAKCGGRARQSKWMASEENRAKHLAAKKRKYEYKRCQKLYEEESEKLRNLQLRLSSKNRLISEQEERVRVAELNLQTLMG